ncbi:MAG: DNA repair protein RadC [Paludibacteraceae bacterium]|nr:DNA repair protein RadC [Paludibacteraceae bacterium]
MKIKDMAHDDMPREKLMEKGAQACSDSELLAILLRSGTAGMSVLEMSRQLLSSSGNNLDALGRKSIDELTSIKGLGRTKAITLAAAFELGNRRALCGVQKRTQITQTDQMVEVFRSVLNNKDHEEFWVAYLDQSHHLIKNERISEGGYTSTIADVRKILREALVCKAQNIAVAHNHPSGNPSPSRDDEALTRKIKEAARLMDIRLLDHIIIAHNQYYSFSENGLL